jgi:hypothetical protein
MNIKFYLVYVLCSNERYLRFRTAYVRLSDASHACELASPNYSASLAESQTGIVTSILRAEKHCVPTKDDRYFDFKHLKIRAHLNISFEF